MRSFLSKNCFSYREIITNTGTFLLKKRKPKKTIINFCFLLLTGLLINSFTWAQTSPADCRTGCTSNDVQIQKAYLSNAAGVELPSNFVCPASGTASVYLTLELTTKTPRIGVVIYTNIKNFTPPSTIGSLVSNFSQCFGTNLNQPTNKVTFLQAFNWTCGNPIVLTDVFIGWGTGNTDFCTGTGFQCPATSSKCYQLPAGEYIPIQTPTASPASATQCSTNPGGTTSVFDLTALESTVKGSQVTVTVNWWESLTGGVPANNIANPATYSSISKTVYAKVKSNADSTVFSVSSVTLTVNTTPTATTTSDTKCSATAGGTTATFDLTTLESTVKGSQSNVSVSWFSNSGLSTTIETPGSYSSATATVYAKVTNTNATTCYSSIGVSLIVNSRPTNAAVSVSQPTCASANGSVTVTSPTGTDYEYKNNSGDWQASASFTVAANASYSILVRNKNSLCTSLVAAAGTMGAQPSNPSTPAVCVIQPSLCGPATGSVKFTDLGTGYQYTINGTDWQNCPAFLNVAAGAATSLKVRNSLLCESPAANCNTICSSAPVACPQNRGEENTTAISETIFIPVSSSLGIKAFPNPFRNAVKFVVSIPEAGNGTLELVNMMGQRVKTVYQGRMAAGINNFEVTLPAAQSNSLIYILRMGDKQITGKLLQLNQ